MKQISKTDFARIQEYIGHIDEHRNEIDNIIADAQMKIDEAMSKLNDYVDEANGFLSDLHSEAENYYDERSDAWRDGDNGQQYYDWVQEISSAVDTLQSVCFAIEAEDAVSPCDDMIEALGNLRQSYQE